MITTYLYQAMNELMRWPFRASSIIGMKWIVLFFLCTAETGYAAPTLEQLVSELQSALDAHDKAAFERCFDFDETDAEAQEAYYKMEDAVFSWPSHVVVPLARGGKGKLSTSVNGKNYTLNGKFTAVVGIYLSAPPSRGFTLPVGIAHGEYYVLRTVEEKR